MKQTNIKPRTVKLIRRLLNPLTEEGVVDIEEEKEIIAQLKSLSEKGEQLPNVEPRLIDQRQAAEMLGISHANFKKLEREGKLKIPRKNVGSAVRYRNVDILRFIMENDE